MAALGLLLLGCAAHELQQVSPEGARARRVAALADGKTTREQVLEEWGPPSARFEDGRILSYRLDAGFSVTRVPYPGSPRPGEAPLPSRWVNAFYDLVLVFDPAGVLAEHRLLRVR